MQTGKPLCTRLRRVRKDFKKRVRKDECVSVYSKSDTHLKV
jgi:hypothetical protein